MIAAIAFTEVGYALGERLGVCVGERYSLVRCGDGGLPEWTATHFTKADALVFIGACGIAVRAIAPYIKKKTKDPAVLVIDELGKFVIPILSGHIGGGNALAEKLAEYLSAAAVITTATDCHGGFALDAWAAQCGMQVEHPERIKFVSGKLLRGETVRIKCLFPVKGHLPKGIALEDVGYDAAITWQTEKAALSLVPRVVALGVGCKKGTGEEEIEQAVCAALETAGCSKNALLGVFSIDVKQWEPGLLAFCSAQGLPFVTFSSDALQMAEGTFSASSFVEQTVGVDNVCERSAVLGSGGGSLLLRKYTQNGVTVALALAPYAVTFSEGA